MNDVLNYICRGLVTSDRTIRRQSADILRLSRNNCRLAIGLGVLAIGGILVNKTLLENTRKINQLQARVDHLSQTVEELKPQEGA